MQASQLRARAPRAFSSRAAPVSARRPLRVLATASPIIESPLLKGKAWQFMNPVWGTVENEEQFFKILKVR